MIPPRVFCMHVMLTSFRNLLHAFRLHFVAMIPPGVCLIAFILSSFRCHGPSRSFLRSFPSHFLAMILPKFLARISSSCSSAVVFSWFYCSWPWFRCNNCARNFLRAVRLDFIGMIRSGVSRASDVGSSLESLGSVSTTRLSD